MGRRLLVGVFLGLAFYVALAVWADASKIVETFRRIPVWVVPAVCALSLANYGVRFWKWKRYCELLDIRVDLHKEPIGELRRQLEYFKPLIPYFLERPYNPRIGREDLWLAEQRKKGR
jgi:hypothetical protein